MSKFDTFEKHYIGEMSILYRAESVFCTRVCYHQAISFFFQGQNGTNVGCSFSPLSCAI